MTTVGFLAMKLAGLDAWPWWWSVVLSLAWAPLLWLPACTEGAARAHQLVFGLMAVLGLTMAAMVAHVLPLGLHDAPDSHLGVIALWGMGTLYVFQVLLQKQAQLLFRWRRWSYAGFYLDEAYTRLALLLWPVAWAPASSSYHVPAMTAARLADTPN